MANHTTLLEPRRPELRSGATTHHVTTVAAQRRPVTGAAPEVNPAVAPAVTEPLLREALGTTLRAFREDSRRTLRDLAVAASVSPGYLSELERGRKEVSSELLASICHALGVQVSTVILEAAEMMAFDVAAAELAAGMDSNRADRVH
ncbi:helix-turn-helix domain-containing protein [Corynebacterium neomassiliense]|uniref:helix-turn-helix domain-containing protein n=1 Tax=Corynebacterium neomassiliense TaxID=2079482 RepID=UPI001032227E|nr:helix-turn-helix transcriptional regulator [Corynebacterium neomassiliense]